MPKILAIASKGGHWEQLMLLRPAFEGGHIYFACTDNQQGAQFTAGEFYSISDYSRSKPLQATKGFFELFSLVQNLRPDVIISTGAAPGLLGLLCGRLLGAKTIWVDSIANSQKISLSGSLARRFCHITLTQWEHLSHDARGFTYWGSVL